MKILFEGHRYRNQGAGNLLPKDYYDISTGNPKPRVVGYHYSEKNNCPIIILPKVFLNENNLFFIDDIDPEIFIEDGYLNLISNPIQRSQISNFLFECSSWFYFSIKKYFHKFNDTLSIFEDKLNIVDCSHKGNFHTEIDLIFSLLKFNKENKDLFLFIKKINKSQNNKIDWNKTLKNSLPFIDANGSPIYTETQSKRKQINADEDLLVLFFSVLKDIEKTYNFNVKVNPYYNLLSQKEFNKIKRRGTYYLRNIRYKYFDDRLLTLYRLLYAYFEKIEDSNIKEKRDEYLIIKDYNLVFQDMVDELLSDAYIPDELKKHKDGKELDHIYKSKSFFEEDGIYFIGDSKYYRRGNPVEDKSIYKQFTYAKNVVQYNINLFNDPNKGYPNGIRYRDELTEGYNITPNYFIRGTVNNLNYHKADLDPDPDQNIDLQTNIHWEDRLFDRDTLIVQSYCINFLFVLRSYISTKSIENNRFKNEAKNTFRESLINYFNEKFSFSLVKTEDISNFIKTNFYHLNGRVYRPSNFQNENNFILALNIGTSAKDFLAQKTTGTTSVEEYNIS